MRNVLPVKINEVRFSDGANPSDQFIELCNASDVQVDISHWSLVSTPSQCASVELATIPPETKVAAHGFYLLGLSASELAAPANSGATTVNDRGSAGLVGQQIDIDGEIRTIVSVGTPAAAMTTVFIPVSTGSWLQIPAGSTNPPVTRAAGFGVGQEIGIDIGGNFELATVTAVGKAGTQTTLAKAAAAGATSTKVAANSDVTVGDTLTVGTGGPKEIVMVKSIVSVSTAPFGGGRGGFGVGGGGNGGGEIELAPPRSSSTARRGLTCPTWERESAFRRPLASCT